MEIFRAANIVKKFHRHTALDKVNISVRNQSIFGLLGPNGAGKTSLIRIITQITAPDSGELFFNNEKLSPKHTREIGYLPEERGLYKKMEVGEQVLYLARLKGLTKQESLKKLKYWFEKFEIQNWWKKKVEELSKGMQQKVQFIVTILHEPKLLILDEPFSGFDPINANLIKNEILELRDKGSTIIFSTHNMSSVEELCDHIALINKSKCILSGSVKEIKKEYSSNIFEIAFTGNMIAFTNALWTGAEIMEHSQHLNQCKARVKLLGRTNPNELIQSVLPYVEIHGLKEIVPAMNDIFISKVQEENGLIENNSLTE